MSLLPSESDATVAEDADPRVIDVESDDADQLLGALSSETARNVLTALHEEPAPPAELADRIDTSLQNAQYHLEQLEAAGAVRVVDTAYSEKGREMDVYAPANRPLVIFAGDQDSTSSIRTALSRLLGGLAVVTFASLMVEQLFGGGVAAVFGGDGGATGAVAETTRAAAARTGTPGGQATTGAGDVAVNGADSAAAALPVGAVFFLGAASVLVAGFLAWYAQTQR